MPSAITVIAMIADGVLLSISMKVLPHGTASTVWTGIRAVGSFLLGMAILGEPASPMRQAAGALILSGILMMKLAST
ncbi:DMT family transporter [Rhizobium giardinii]|uniref:Guanidinium exporter n=2 Tax=Rhizobium giardinii TaxID=56731 RepID=A0A7W8UCL4_9HYPH|nr:quaternary ammonium compound-resistance protein SugE [Rhizobium giardinii]